MGKCQRKCSPDTQVGQRGQLSVGWDFRNLWRGCSASEVTSMSSDCYLQSQPSEWLLSAEYLLCAKDCALFQFLNSHTYKSENQVV